MSPFLFLLIVKGPSKLIKNAKCRVKLKGIKVSSSISLTHMLFVDDIIIFGEAKDNEWESFKLILDCFCKATGMIINVQKSQLLFHKVREDIEVVVLNSFPYPHNSLDNGLKYLGFSLNPNEYKYTYWLWLYKKIEAIIMCWCNRWISRGSRLILVKFVLESILVYGSSIVYIPKGILDKIQKKYFRFLWTGRKQQDGIPSVKWAMRERPKDFREWGLKTFTSAKTLWRMLMMDCLWEKLMRNKYIQDLSVEDWIQTHPSVVKGASII